MHMLRQLHQCTVFADPHGVNNFQVCLLALLAAGLRMLVKCLMESLPLLVDNFFLLLWLFFAFGIIGLNVFMGRLRKRCMYYDAGLGIWSVVPDFEDSVCGFASCPSVFSYQNMTGLPPMSPEPPLSPSMQMIASPNASSSSMGNMITGTVSCRSGNQNPGYGYIGFDNFGLAALNIFDVITLDNWSQNQLYPLWHAMGPGVPVTVLVFVIIFCVFFGLQLFVAIMSSKFAQLASAAVSGSAWGESGLMAYAVLIPYATLVV